MEQKKWPVKLWDKRRGPLPAHSPLPRNVPRPNQNAEAIAALPVCDWVYFATPSPEDFATTRKFVREFGIIIRTIFNSAGIPVANVKQLQQGDTILLVHGGGRGKDPYQPMFSCLVVAPPRPAPHFDAFSFADEPQQERLRISGYLPDPRFKRFTGISVKVLRDVERPTCSIPRPLGNNTIRRWDEVFGAHYATKDEPAG